MGAEPVFYLERSGRVYEAFSPDEVGEFTGEFMKPVIG
jgi:hypothetical protein